MPRRNDIAKILSVVAAMVFLFFALHPLVRACSLSIERIHVSPDFRVIVRHGSTPIPGIKVEVYDEGDRRSDAETEQKPVLTLVTGRDGVAEIKNLAKG